MLQVELVCFTFQSTYILKAEVFVKVFYYN